MLPCQTLVHDGDEPLEHACVHELGHTVPDDGGLGGAERGHDLLRPCDDLPLDHPLLEVSKIHTKKPSRKKKGRISVIYHGVCSRLCDFHIPEMKKSSEESEDGPLLFDADSDR